jgi:spore photoproduct lyase
MNPKEYTFRIEREFGLRLNLNQTREIQRLVYETTIVNKKDFNTLLKELKAGLENKSPRAKDLFFHIKESLLALRFPETSARQKIKPAKVYLNKLPSPCKTPVFHPVKTINPEKIIAETSTKGGSLEKNLKACLPNTEYRYIDKYSDFLQGYKLNPFNFKRPILFIVNQKQDFIKPCPCTPGHIGCGYWIFNLGFGCPFDCSYCYLQQYQNFPGLILPSNTEDFFTRLDFFLKKLSRPIRIGTGEFCDSLALDHLTNYSKNLIPYFSRKPVLFELKTKSDNITNLLNLKPSKTIIVSWSLNPPHLIKSQEYGTASLKKRLAAAKKIQEHGFSLGFHFDPIIYYKGWEKDYKRLIQTLYSHVRPPFAWISLGSLRFNRNLKIIIEKRFPESKIVYGEMFLGKDNKIRYPEFIRIGLYKKINRWIKTFDRKTPVYLCMESEKVWKESLMNISSSKETEKLLISNNI